MKIGNFNQKRVWFISYFSLVLICVLLNQIIMGRSLRVIDEQINDTIKNAFNTNLEAFSNRIKSEQISMYTIMQKRSVESIANRFNTLNDEILRETANGILDEMNNQFADKYYSSCYILVFDKKDMAITTVGKMSKKSVFDRFLKKAYSDYDTWIDSIFSMKQMTDYRCFKNDFGKKYIVMTQKSIRNIGGHPSTVMVSIIDNNQFFSGISEGSGSAFFISADERLLFSTDNKIDFSKVDTGKTDLKINGVAYKCISRTEDRITYTQLFLTDKYSSRLLRIKVTGLAVNAVLILVGMLLSYYYTFINYKPIRRITSRFNISTDGNNEFNLIEARLEKLLDNKNESQRMLKKKSKAFSEIFTGLIINSESKSEICEIVKKYGVNYKYRGFVVTAFSINNPGDIMSESNSDDENYALAGYAIGNVLLELFQNDGDCSFSSSGRICRSLINLHDGVSIDTVYRNVEKVCTFLYESMNMRVVCNVSEIGGLFDVPLLRRQTETLRLFEARMPDEIIFVAEDTNDYASLVYSNEYKQALLNAINEGNVDAAFELSQDFLNEEFLCNADTENLLKILKGTLLKTYLEASSEGDARSSGLIDSINDADPEQFRLKFMSALGALTRNNRSADKPNEKKIERIISFIEKNYSNVDLNVSYLSNVFGISINHLSRFFKANTGEGPAEYILKYRCFKATELMHDNIGLTVSEISRMCGFYSAGSFIRAFKKIYGVTPGEYKKA